MTTKPGWQIRPFAVGFPAVVLDSFFAHAAGVGRAAVQPADDKLDASKARVEGIVVDESGVAICAALIRPKDITIPNPFS